MRLPLRLQLKPSRHYLMFLASGHALAGMAVCLFTLAWLVRLVLLLCLMFILLHLWRRAARDLPQLLLRADGKIEVVPASGSGLLTEPGDDTLVWPWLVILHLQDSPSGAFLPVFADGLTGGKDAHRQLRVWLRWRSAQDRPSLKSAGVE